MTAVPAGRAGGPGRHRAAAAVTPCSSGAPASTCGPWSTTWTSRAAIPRWPRRSRRSSTTGSAETADLHARLADARPGRRRPDGADQPPAGRAGARGHARRRAGPSPTFGPGLEAYPADRHRPGRALPSAPRRSTGGSRRASRAMVEAGLVDEVRALAARPGGHLAHGAPGARLPRDPGPRRGRRAARRLPGGGGAADPPVRPPPGLLVPPRPADQLGARPRPRRQELLGRALCRARLNGAGCENGVRARHQARGRGQRLPGRARPRRRHPALGGPGAPAGRPPPRHRGRRHHPGRPGPRRLRPLHGAAQRRRGRGRDERQRHPLPGPGRGRRRPGSGPPRFTVATGGGTRTVEYVAGPAPGWATARVDMGPARLGPDQPQEFDDRRARTVDVGNPHLVLLGPDTAAVDVAELGPKLQAAFSGGINVEWITAVTDDEGELLDFRVWERGVGETLACGTGSVAAAAAARSWGAVARRRRGAGAQPGRHPRGHARRRRGRHHLPGRARAQGGRRRHPPGDALLSNLLPGTLIERTFRERIILVGVDLPRARPTRWSTRSSTSWPCWSTARAPTSSAGSCSGATHPTRPPSSGAARPRRSPS